MVKKEKRKEETKIEETQSINSDLGTKNYTVSYGTITPNENGAATL